MAKYAGSVGYATQVETSPGIWKSKITEMNVRGDIINQGVAYQQGEKINDDVNVQHRISIVMPPHSLPHDQIKFVTLWGNAWEVNSIEIRRPRLILTLGGVYNGERETT